MTKIFTKGNVELLKEKNIVSVSGTRKIDKDSIAWLREAFKNLDSNAVVVSGLALGTDTVAHKLALAYDLKTIAVLPSGFGRITPKRNIQLANDILDADGLLISEYPKNMGIESNSQYIERNKLIAKIGNYLIMPQCDKKSGTMSTINFTQKLNKHIVLPDSNYSGNQYVINDKKFKSIIF